MTSDSMQKYARVAGILYLLTMVGGGLGEFYIPNQLMVDGDAAATARNITGNDFLFRLGFFMYLVEAICDVALSLVMYVLLRPVNKSIALLAAFFGLVSTSVFAIGELFYFTSGHLVSGAEYLNTFTPPQLASLSLFSLKIYATCSAIFMALYGIASATRGYLIYRSGYIPGAIGALLMIAGAGFITSNVIVLLAPAYRSDLLYAPMFVAGLSLMLWLLIKGVRTDRLPAH